MVGVTVAASAGTIPFVVNYVGLGFDRVAIASAGVAVAGPIGLLILARKPGWFVGIVHTIFALVTLQQLYLAWLFGGLHESGLAVSFGLLVALLALIVIGRRAAMFWFVMYLVQVVFSVIVAGSVDPTYRLESATAESGLNMVAVGILLMAAVLYFVRQRDRFQQQSDDLLHNILPDEIAFRLKSDSQMIADDFPAVSVLFADIVGFTPLSNGMPPSQLVGLLNDVFTSFDRFVAELELEKIKTVGDEYMVAAGVPTPRPDHAEAIAELALRIRDHVATHEFGGHRLRLRIGINSGPAVAGIIGTHKFAYDMWGDTVNTASRMESEGLPDEIHVGPASFELLRDTDLVFEPRGVIDVRGKGHMTTYLLRGRR